MQDVLDRLARYWERHGVEPASHTADPDEIEAWQRRYSVLLPRDLYEYVSRVNGIKRAEQFEFDHEGLSFLPLSAMCPEQDWVKGNRMSGMFVFADFLISSYWWCASLDLNVRDHTPIYLCGGKPESNRLIADSIPEFLILYMTQHSEIHRFVR